MVLRMMEKLKNLNITNLKINVTETKELYVSFDKLDFKNEINQYDMYEQLNHLIEKTLPEKIFDAARGRITIKRNNPSQKNIELILPYSEKKRTTY